MITEIIFRDGTNVLLGYDGVFSIVHNVSNGGTHDTFHIYYVGGKIITVSEFDRYVSVTA